MPNVVGTLGVAGVKKALDVSTSLYMIRSCTKPRATLMPSLQCRDTLFHWLGRADSHIRGCGSDVPPTIVHKSWCGHCFD